MTIQVERRRLFAPSGIALLALMVLSAGWPTYREQRILIDPKVEWNWMVIEWGNPTCPQLPEGKVQTIRIPLDGLFCTSTKPPDLFNAEYFFDAHGQVTAAPSADKIDRSSSEVNGRHLTLICWASRQATQNDTDGLAVQRHLKKFPAK